MASAGDQKQKDIQRFLNQFAFKFCQVVVQSRSTHRHQQKCVLPSRAPTKGGGSWFWLNIMDADIVGKSSVKPPVAGTPFWVEVAVKTPDQGELLLEVWMVVLNERVCSEQVIDNNITIYTQLSKLLRSTLVVSRTLPAYHLLRKHMDTVMLIHRHERSKARLEGLGTEQDIRCLGGVSTSLGDISVSVAYRKETNFVMESPSIVAITDDHFKVDQPASPSPLRPKRPASQKDSASLSPPALPPLPKAPSWRGSGRDEADGASAIALKAAEFGMEASKMLDLSFDCLLSQAPPETAQSPEPEVLPSVSLGSPPNAAATPPPESATEGLALSSTLTESLRRASSHSAHHPLSLGSASPAGEAHAREVADAHAVPLNTSFSAGSGPSSAGISTSGQELGHAFRHLTKMQNDKALSMNIAACFPGLPLDHLFSEREEQDRRCEAINRFFDAY